MLKIVKFGRYKIFAIFLFHCTLTLFWPFFLDVVWTNSPILKCFEHSHGPIFCKNYQIWKIQNICNCFVPRHFDIILGFSLGFHPDEPPILKCFEASDEFIFAENCQIWRIQNICNFFVPRHFDINVGFFGILSGQTPPPF